MSEEIANIHLPATVDNSPMALLRMALDKGADPEKLKALMDLAERWDARQASIAFGEAITAFQHDCPPVIKANPVYGKDKNLGPQYFFASFDDLMAVAGPIMAKHKIAVTYDTTFANGIMTTTARVRVGSHTETTSVSLGLPVIPNANDSQRAGGALAYGQRYALKAALGIVVTGEDNDAQGQNAGIPEKEVVEINALLDRVYRKFIASGGKEENWEKGKGNLFAKYNAKDLNDFPPDRVPSLKHDLEQKLKG